MAETKRRRRRGYTRLSSKRQVTIPIAILKEAGLGAADELKVELDGRDRIVLNPAESLAERRRRAIKATAGSLPGIWEPDSLERLRNEWC